MSPDSMSETDGPDVRKMPWVLPPQKPQRTHELELAAEQQEVQNTGLAPVPSQPVPLAAQAGQRWQAVAIEAGEQWRVPLAARV